MATRKRMRTAGSPTHLLVSPDSFLREQRRQEIIADHVPEEARDFAVARFSLARTPLAEVLAQALMRPMLSRHQVLVLTEVEALSESQVAELEEYLAAPADFTVLVFEAAELDRRTRLARRLLEHCQVFEPDATDDSEAVRAAVSFARELELKLDAKTAEDLVFLLGNDQGRLRAELEKLRAYVGRGGRVTWAEVADLVTPARRFSVFELADLLAERRRPEALLLLRRLMEAGESPIGVVGLLAWLYRQLLQAQSLPTDMPTWKAAQTLRAPGSKVGTLLRQARRFSQEELRDAFKALLEADVALKSTPPNPAAILEALVTRLAGSRPAGAEN